MRILFRRNTLLIAIVLGAVYPLTFGLLASIYNPGRDELPSLDNPMGVLGLCGGSLFAAPLVATYAGLSAIVDALHAHGYGLPLFDSLVPQAQMIILLAPGLIFNVLCWLVPGSIFRRCQRNVL
jgi:hypothetical protein